jgi:hypothetical protein
MISTSRQNQQTLKVLQQRWWGITAVSLTLLILTYGWLRLVWPDHANRWLVFASLSMAYCLWIVWQGLVENHRAGETMLLATLGWGNRLTLMRGLAISLVAGFLFSPWPQGALAWLPVLLYTAADIADYFDGFAARVTNHATKLGERLDMEFDGLGMLVVSILGGLVWAAAVVVFDFGAGALFVCTRAVVARKAWTTDLRDSSQRASPHFCRVPDGIHERGAVADFACQWRDVGRNAVCDSHGAGLFAGLVGR